MKTYDIVKLEYSEYKYLIVSTSFETPFKYLQDINEDLRKTNEANIKVLFDLMANLGNSSDRYIEANFNGKELVRISFSEVTLRKNDPIRGVSCKYFNSNIELLDRCMLNSAQKRMICKGIAI